MFLNDAEVEKMYQVINQNRICLEKGERNSEIIKIFYKTAIKGYLSENFKKNVKLKMT